MQSREIRLHRRPVGMPQPEDFELATVEVPAPEDGQVQVQNLCMSVDPYMRGRMIDRKSYTPPFQVGEPLNGGAIGRVVASADPDHQVGEHVSHRYGWREAFTCPGKELQGLGELTAPASAYLGAIGMPGMTAYVGLLEVGALKDGETVFVSGAAGAVGSIVGQIAKLHDCRVLGSAGSAEKVSWLTDDLGFDYAFNYHDGSILDHLREGAPDGIDVYFDNVGGEHLQSALTCMRPEGRIPLCGAISMYNATEPVPGPNNLTMAIGLSLTLRGFIVSNFSHLAQQFRQEMEEWVTNGTIKYRETIVEGIEKAPEAFIGLFTGANTGKMVVTLG